MCFSVAKIQKFVKTEMKNLIFFVKTETNKKYQTVRSPDKAYTFSQISSHNHAVTSYIFAQRLSKLKLLPFSCMNMPE